MDIVMLLNFEVIKLFIIDFKHIWKFIYKHRQRRGFPDGPPSTYHPDSVTGNSEPV